MALRSVWLAVVFLFMAIPAYAAHWTAIDVHEATLGEYEISAGAALAGPVSTSDSGWLVAYHPEFGRIDMHAGSRVVFDGGITLLSGRITIHTGEKELLLSFANAKALKLEANATAGAEAITEPLVWIVPKEIPVTEAAVDVVAEASGTWVWRDGDWLPTSETPPEDWPSIQWWQQDISAALDFETPPEIQSVKAASQRMDVGGSEETAASGESVCLESSGSEGSAGTVTGDGSGVAIEQQQATVRVQVKWERE